MDQRLRPSVPCWPVDWVQLYQHHHMMHPMDQVLVLQPVLGVVLGVEIG